MNWPLVPLQELLVPVARRVEVDQTASYKEIGIRSHGKGIFHKAPVIGLELGDKQVHRIEPGDFVVNIVFAWEGAVAVAGPNETGYIGSHRFPTFRPIAEELDADFLRLYFMTPAGLAVLDRVSPGGAGRNRTLSRSKFLSERLPLPSLDEQRRIVAKVNSVQVLLGEAEDAATAVPPLLVKLRHAVLAAAFRGELTTTWRRGHPNAEPANELLVRIRADRRRKWRETNPNRSYVEPISVNTDGLPDLPKGWCWASMDELIVNIVGGKSPQAGATSAGPGEFGVLKVSAVSWGEFDPRANKILLGGPLAGVASVTKDDLLISRANTAELVGAVVLVREDHPNLFLCDKTLRLDVTPHVSKDYLLHAMRTAQVRAVFGGAATGTSDSMRNISHAKIRSAPVPLAPAAEQDQVVQRLQQVLDLAGRQVRRDETLLQVIAALNQSILAKAFRGELVSQDPNDEPASKLLERIRAERDGGVPRSGKRRGGAGPEVGR